MSILNEFSNPFRGDSISLATGRSEPNKRNYVILDQVYGRKGRSSLPSGSRNINLKSNLEKSYRTRIGQNGTEVLAEKLSRNELIDLLKHQRVIMASYVKRGIEPPVDEQRDYLLIRNTLSETNKLANANTGINFNAIGLTDIDPGVFQSTPPIGERFDDEYEAYSLPLRLMRHNYEPASVPIRETRSAPASVRSAQTIRSDRSFGSFVQAEDIRSGLRGLRQTQTRPSSAFVPTVTPRSEFLSELKSMKMMPSSPSPEVSEDEEEDDEPLLPKTGSGIRFDSVIPEGTLYDDDVIDEEQGSGMAKPFWRSGAHLGSKHGIGLGKPRKHKSKHSSKRSKRSKKH